MIRTHTDQGPIIRDTTIAEVEAVADAFGRPVVESDGFYAVVRSVGDRVLILRAPVEVAS